jgi:hypothetical protein
MEQMENNNNDTSSELNLTQNSKTGRNREIGDGDVDMTVFLGKYLLEWQVCLFIFLFYVLFFCCWKLCLLFMFLGEESSRKGSE